MPSISFEQAKGYVLQFGKHRGETLDAVASDDNGLLYLDRLVDEDWLFDDTRKAIQAYLNDPDIAVELKRLLEGN